MTLRLYLRNVECWQMESANKSYKSLFKCSAFVLEMLKYYGDFSDWKQLMTSLCKQTNQFWTRKRMMLETLDSMFSRDTNQILMILKKCSISACLDSETNLTVKLSAFINDKNSSKICRKLKDKKLRNIKTIRLIINPFLSNITNILVCLITENIVKVEAIEIIKLNNFLMTNHYSILCTYDWKEFKIHLSKRSIEIGLKKVKIFGNRDSTISYLINDIQCDTLELEDCNMDMSPEYFASYITSIYSSPSLTSINTLSLKSCFIRYCCENCLNRAKEMLCKSSPYQVTFEVLDLVLMPFGMKKHVFNLYWKRGIIQES